MKLSLIPLLALVIPSCGAVHFSSFDGVNFDFDGHGEYIAFCGEKNGDVSSNLNSCRPNSDEVLENRNTISLNYRFSKIDPSHNGRVIVGVGIEDPTFRKGKRALTIVTHPTQRLAVYSGADMVKFHKRKGQVRKLKKKVSGAKILMSPNVNDTSFVARIGIKSGLTVRIRENYGSLTVGILKRPKGSNEFVGLLGIPDNNPTNDFTASDGTVMEGACEFGYTWMVRRKASSVFKDLTGALVFENFYYPDHICSQEPNQ